MQMQTFNLPMLAKKMSNYNSGLLNQGRKKGSLPLPPIKKWLASCPSIRYKIGAGFAAAIGVAMLGVVSGNLVEHFYNEQAGAKLLQATQQTKRLNELKTTLLQLHLLEHQLASLDLKPENFKQEHARLLGQLNQLKSLLSKNKLDFKALDSQKLQLNSPGNSDQLRQFIRTEQINIEIYSQNLQALLQQTSPDVIAPQQVQKAQQKFKAFIHTNVAKKFDNTTDKAVKLADNFSKEETAAFQAIEKADQLCRIIIVSSLLISAAIATIVAVQLSKAIAYPLEVTTAVAQRVTKTSNFHLKAPVTTNDEVGRLATALNQMIQRIDNYTHELEQAQLQLIQSEKMSSLGTMVAGVAHEVNNPINFIHGNLYYISTHVQNLLSLVQLYQNQYPNVPIQIKQQADAIDFDFLAEDLPKMLGSMKIGTERIRQIVLSLRNFSRLDEAQLKEVDLHEGIDNSILLIANRLKTQIEIVKKYGKIPRVECYPAQLNQVFMNILNNAVDTLLSDPIGFGKLIEIKTQYSYPDQVQVRIRDNGTGMNPEMQKKVFDPFFTTKPVGQGTGLGLAIAYQIVEKHQGTIRINSQIGQGTEFIITLPVKQSARTCLPTLVTR